jgi:ankyrin repeat protein
LNFLNKRKIFFEEKKISKRSRQEELSRQELPQTFIYNYPVQLYLRTVKLGMSSESYLVEKMGNNTVKAVRNGSLLQLSPAEYDALEPINPRAVEERDKASRLALEVVSGTEGQGESFLDLDDTANLAATNRTVLAGLLGYGNPREGSPSFKRSRGASQIFIKAIRTGDMELFRLFRQSNAPIFLPNGSLDNYNYELEEAIIVALRYSRVEMLEEIIRTWPNYVYDAFEKKIYVVIRTRRFDVFQLFLRALIDSPMDEGMAEREVRKKRLSLALYWACKAYWKDAIRYLAQRKVKFPYPMPLHRRSPMYEIINGGDYRLLFDLVIRLPPEEQHHMLTWTREGDVLPIQFALIQQRYDMVLFMLSRSTPGLSVTVRLGYDLSDSAQTLAIAIHYRTRQNGEIVDDSEAPLDIVQAIINDIGKNTISYRSSNNEDGEELETSQQRFKMLSFPYGTGTVSPDERYLLTHCCMFREDRLLDCAKLLLGAGANPDFGTTHRRTTPLIEACLRKNIELVKLLLDAGSDPNYETNFFVYPVNADFKEEKIKYRPLYMALEQEFREQKEQQEYIKIARLLISRGANPYKKIAMRVLDTTSRTDILSALSFSSFLSGQTEGAKFLIYEYGIQFPPDGDPPILFLEALVKGSIVMNQTENEDKYIQDLAEGLIDDEYYKMLEKLISHYTNTQKVEVLNKLLYNLSSDNFNGDSAREYDFIYSFYPESMRNLRKPQLISAIRMNILEKVEFLVSRGLIVDSEVIQAAKEAITSARDDMAASPDDFDANEDFRNSVKIFDFLSKNLTP